MRSLKPVLKAFFVLSATVFFYLGCGGGHHSPPPPVAPTITTQPANQTVLEGVAATFSVVASGTEPLSYQWNKGGVAITGATSASYTTPATVAATDNGTSFTVTVTNSAGSVTSSAATLTVHTNPAIASFTATPGIVTAGSSATLAFSFTGGTGTIDNNVGTVTSGTNKIVTPAATTTYTLTVDNGFGLTKTLTATVTVAPVPVAPTIVVPSTVTAAKAGLTASVTAQTGMTYAWTITNGAITAGQGTTQITFTAGAVGTTGLTCTATNAAGATAPTSTTLTVVAAPVATSLAASTTTPLYGATVTLTPTFSGGTGVIDHGIGTVTSGTGYPTAALTAATTYTLTVTNAAGDAATTPVTVTPQTVAISAVTPANPTITAGTSQAFSSTVSGAANSAITWAAAGSAGSWSGSTWTAPATAGTYTITATSVADGTKTASTTVTVAPVPVTPVVTAPANATTSKVGYTASVPAQTGMSYTWALVNGTITAGQGTTQITFTAGSVGTTTVSCAVTNAAGASSGAGSFSVNVVAAATASIAASTTSPLYGDTTVTVTPTFLGATSARVGTSQGGSDISASPTSGSPIPVQTSGFTTAKAYWVRATNGAGDSVDSNVLVTPQTVTISAVTPANPTITASTSQAFSSTVSGAFNSAITWTATGSAGSWSGSTWTAPATAGTYTITATSVADGTKTASTTVTVAPVPVTPVITATGTVTTGKTGLTASVPAQAGMTYSWSLSSGSITAGQGTTQITFTAGAAGTTTVSCTVTNAAGLSATAGTFSETVVAAPVATSLVATPSNNPLYGATVTLTPTFTGGTGVIDHGIGTVTSGTGYPTAALTAATTYTLTVTNAANDTATTSATVTPQTVSVSPVTPAGLIVTVNASQNFSSSVAGALNSAITWTASGGSINANTGAWTAPASAGGPFTITATSQADGTKSAFTTVTVVPAPVVPTISVPANVTTGKTGLLASVAAQAGMSYAWGISGGTITSASNASSITFTAGAVGTLSLSCTVTNTATTPVSATGNASTNVVAAPGIVAFASVPASPVLYGATATLWPNFFGGTGAINNGIGTVSSGVGYTIPTPVTTSTTYTLTVTNAAGDSVAQDYVVAPQPVTISAVTPANPTITASTSQAFSSMVSGAFNSAITWTATGGAGSWSGSTWTAPAVAGTYTITATSVADGTKTASTTVTVAPVPVTPVITATGTVTTGKTGLTASVPAQAGMTYSWSLSSGSITAGQGTTQITFTAGAVGTTTVSCTVTNAAGLSATAGTFSETVVAAPVATSLAASTTTPLYGATVTLTPTFSGGTGVIDHGIGTVTSGTGYPTAALIAATTYTLTVTNTAGDTATAPVTVTPQPVSISAVTPANPTITASTSQAFSSTVSGAFNSAITWTATGSAGSWSGSTWTAPAAAGTYTITATSVADGTKSASTTVTVAPIPVTPVITATATVQANWAGLTASVPAQAGMSYSWNLSSGSINAGQGTTQITYTAGPVGTTTLSCTVTNAAGLSATPATFSETVVAAAVVTSFTASTTTPLYGATVTLTPTFTGGTGVIDHGVGTVTSGTGYTTPALTAATTYTLTVTNAAGISAPAATVTVTPQTVVVGPVTPANRVETVGTSLDTFSASVTGAVNTAVTWTAGAGTINPATGNWLAPATPGGPYTITATSVADPSKSNFTTATVVAAPVTPVVTAPISAPSGQSGLTAFVSVQPGMNYFWNLSSGSITNGQGTAAITFTAGAVGTTTVSCTVSNTATAPAVATGNAFVNVVALPVINSFTASPDTILTLSSSTLSFSFAGGTGTIDHGVGTVTSGVNVTVNPAVTTAYTLTVTPSVGTPVTAIATVTVGTAPVFSTNLPLTQSVPQGTSNFTLTVVTSGNPAVPPDGYQWYFNSSPVSGATASSYTLGTVNSGMTGSYQVVATNSLGSTPSNTLVLTVTTNHNVNGNVQLANGGGGAPGVTVSINTTPVTTTTTDSNGNFTLANIPDGPYVVTPSITLGGVSGPSAATFIPATQSVTVAGADQGGINLQAVLGYTVSGTVSYIGLQTGPVYLSISNGNGSTYGVSIPWPSSNGGAFSIRGVPPNPNQSAYTLTAFMDAVGLGNANASDPAATLTNISLGFIPLTGLSVHLTDPAPVTPTQPTLQGVIPFDSGAVMSYKPALSSGVETAMSYKVQWSTDSTFTTGVTTRTFQATGDNTDIYFTTGLPNGSTYFFRMRGLVGSTQGPWSSTSSATIGGSTAGTHSVSGTINLGVAPATSAPLAVVLVPTGNGMPIVTWIAAPTQTQAYNITGVPDGTYQLIAILDQNNNGIVDPGDLSNTGSGGGDNQTTITVAGSSLTGQNLTLSGASAVASVTTQHWQQPSNVYYPEGYQLNYRVDSNIKLPVNVAVQLGTNPLSLVDVGLNSNGGDRYQFWVPSNLMNVGDPYSVTVGYSDATSDTLTPTVTGVLATSAFAQNLAPTGTGDHSGSNADAQPTFSWSAPSIPPAGGYTYQFWIYPNMGGTIWQVPGNNSNTNGLPSTVTSLVWGVDPTDGSNQPNPSSLTVGTTYNWTVAVQDNFGNSGQIQVPYTP